MVEGREHEILHKDFAVSTFDGYGQCRLALTDGNKRERGHAMHRHAPAYGQASRSGNRNPNTGKTARTASDQNFVSPAACRKRRDPGNEPFGMAPPDAFMAFRNDVLPIEQGYRAIRPGRFYDQPSSASTPSSDPMRRLGSDDGVEALEGWSRRTPEY